MVQSRKKINLVVSEIYQIVYLMNIRDQSGKNINYT